MNASAVGKLFATVTGHHPSAIETRTMDTATGAEKHESLKYSNEKKVTAIRTTTNKAGLLNHIQQEIHTKRNETVRKILGVFILLLEHVSSFIVNKDTNEIQKQHAHLIKTKNAVDEKITTAINQ